MNKYKKILGVYGLLVGFACYADQETFNTDLAEQRMVEIMHAGPHGLTSSYKNIALTQTANLALDLNLSDIVAAFTFQTRILGSNFLSNAFDRLISSKDQSLLLQDRQHALTIMSQNPECKAKLLNLLQQAAQHEAVILKFMQSKQTVLENVPQGYLGQVCLKSPIVQMSNQLKWAGIATAAGFGLHQLHENKENLFAEKPAILESLESVVQEYILKQANDSLEKIAENEFILNNFDTKKYTNAKQLQSHQEKKDRLQAGRLKIEQVISIVEKAMTDVQTYAHLVHHVAYAATATLVGIASYSVYQMYQTHLEGLRIRDAIYSINQLIIIAEQIESVCKEYGVKSQCAMSRIADKETLALINALKAYRYSDNSSFFVASSLVRTFMYEVYEKDMCLAPVFASIAEMDALHAIADVMVAADNADNRFCFVEFVDQEKPMIQLNQFWNVLVKNAVANSMHTDCNVILTGPNAGGKSTSIRAILQNIVFAQSFGFVAAQQCSMTQFDVVHSFINVSDDILGGLSLFATEIQRAQDIMTQVENLPSDQKYFFALDELFTGTNAQDGEMCACSFIKNIANYDNIQFMYATHFDQLKNLGATNQHCINYKIDAPAQDEHGTFIRNEKGKLLYPYTLSLGANNISVAQEIARDAGLMKTL